MLKRELEDQIKRMVAQAEHLQCVIDSRNECLGIAHSKADDVAEKHRDELDEVNNQVNIAKACAASMECRLARRERELAKSRRNSAALQDTLVLLTVKYTVGKDLEVVE